MSTKRPHFLVFLEGSWPSVERWLSFPHQPLVRALEACVCAGVDVGKSLASFLLQLPRDRISPEFQNFTKEKRAQTCDLCCWKERAGACVCGTQLSQAGSFQVENWRWSRVKSRDNLSEPLIQDRK